jgi:CRP/FNR family transcriptional regulator, cyclic AMP receptor protein
VVEGTFAAQLTELERERLRELGVERRFPRRAVLMYQDEPDDRVILIVGGRVKVSRASEQGDDLLLSIRDAGDLLGELAFIGGGERVATVSALEPVRAWVIPAGAFRAHLERTPRVAFVLLEVVARRFRQATLERLQLGTLDTMGRLAARLVALVERYGEPCASGATVELPLSREELASWTGASRAGLAEALKQMRELGWIELERQRLTVRDLPALRARSA